MWWVVVKSYSYQTQHQLRLSWGCVELRLGFWQLDAKVSKSWKCFGLLDLVCLVLPSNWQVNGYKNIRCMVPLATIRYNLVSLGTTWYPWLPLVTIVHHWVPFGTIGNYLVPLGTIWYHWVPFSIIENHLVPWGTIGTIKYHWVPLGTIGYHWVPFLVRFREFQVCQEANPEWVTEWVTDEARPWDAYASKKISKSMVQLAFKR